MLTWARNSLYASQVTLWEDTCQQAPHNSRTRMLLGTAYLAENRADRAREQFEIAAEQFRRKLALNPDAAATYCELALVLPELDRSDEVPALYQNALQLQPKTLPSTTTLPSSSSYPIDSRRLPTSTKLRWPSIRAILKPSCIWPTCAFNCGDGAGRSPLP